MTSVVVVAGGKALPSLLLPAEEEVEVVVGRRSTAGEASRASSIPTSPTSFSMTYSMYTYIHTYIGEEYEREGNNKG